MLYFAYGMNTNQTSMAARCPDACHMGAAKLLDHEFRFASHADVIESKTGTCVDGLLWSITDQCLRSLDVLEGYPWYYDRKLAQVNYQNQILTAVVYYMQPGNSIVPPSAAYFDCVLEGYRTFKIPTHQLWSSLDYSVAKMPHNQLG